MEYCPFGCLEKYLRVNRPYFINQIDPETGIFDSDIGSQRPPTGDSAYDGATPGGQRRGTRGRAQSKKWRADYEHKSGVFKRQRSHQAIHNYQSGLLGLPDSSRHGVLGFPKGER
ncbi:unnamed protein product [Darwinula stevensoni]|uniref:Uncharacterized protein n=1 Tax=Darwinula stevensoni TaxID=69355 RepID=A0A7R9AHX3_9CRUS|nr:unnamed protein product [Darwinula stevensoni]CAG0905989.1 unnamed protein product [Darwinula stevensoni]